MIIRKIMKVIAISILVSLCLYIAYKFLFSAEIDLFGKILGSMIVNLILWVAMHEKLDGFYLEPIYLQIWHGINKTIYSAGLYWLIFGLYKLWVKAPEIEKLITNRIHYIKPKSLKSTGGNLSFPSDDKGKLSLIKRK